MQPKKSVEHSIVDRIHAGYFREKNGYRVLRPQGTGDWLLIYTLRGAGELGHSGGSGIVTSPGDVILLRPGTLHDYKTYAPTRRWDLLWAHFHPRPDWQAWLEWPSISPGLMRLSLNNTKDRGAVERALRKMNDLAIGSNRLSKTMAMNALEEALLWCAKQTLRPRDYDPRVEQAEAYLCQHLSDNVTLDHLADVVGLSVSRLSAVFKQHTGVSPLRYYEVKRLERARQLLEITLLPIKSISAQLGFENPFYFTLRFKKYTGKSPRLYRAELT